MAQLVASGFHVTDVQVGEVCPSYEQPKCRYGLRQEVLPHCDGSTVRCEAVLRVAFAARLHFCRISRHHLLVFLPFVV